MDEKHTFEFEREVIGQVATFVVTPEERHGFWVPDLQCPEIKHTLRSLLNY